MSEQCPFCGMGWRASQWTKIDPDDKATWPECGAWVVVWSGDRGAAYCALNQAPAWYDPHANDEWPLHYFTHWMLAPKGPEDDG